MPHQDKRRASLQAGSEALYDKLHEKPATDSSAVVSDYMYHLGVGSDDPRLALFKDTKFVCMMGSNDRAHTFAKALATAFDMKYKDVNLEPHFKTERFHMYKVGQVVSVSHGMGMPSMSILLHEITKFLKFAGATDYTFMRLGTSGGVGIPGGSVVIAKDGISSDLRPIRTHVVMAKPIEMDASFDAALVDEAFEYLKTHTNLPMVKGRTLGVDDFFVEQHRLDSAYGTSLYTEADKMAWLQRLCDMGVTNIEMEAPEFAAFCKRMNIPALLICVTLLNRMDGDQVTTPAATLAEWSGRAQAAAIALIKHKLGYAHEHAKLHV